MHVNDDLPFCFRHVVSLLMKTRSHLDSLLFLGAFLLLTKRSEAINSACSFLKHFCLALWTWQSLLSKIDMVEHLHLSLDEPNQQVREVSGKQFFSSLFSFPVNKRKSIANCRRNSTFPELAAMTKYWLLTCLSIWVCLHFR